MKDLRLKILKNVTNIYKIVLLNIPFTAANHKGRNDFIIVFLCVRGVFAVWKLFAARRGEPQGAQRCFYLLLVGLVLRNLSSLCVRCVFAVLKIFTARRGEPQGAQRCFYLLLVGFVLRNLSSLCVRCVFAVQKIFTAAPQRTQNYFFLILVNLVLKKILLSASVASLRFNKSELLNAN